jgi:hypothetical protein
VEDYAMAMHPADTAPVRWTEAAPAPRSEVTVALRRAGKHAPLARRSRTGEPLPVRAYRLLPFIGATTAAALTSLAAFVPPSLPDGRAHVVATAVGLFVTLLAPLTGVPVARSIVDGRYAARLDRVAIAVVFLGGVVACLVTVLLR